ncbi:sigma factor-like helix-turn-helix DNA-binding protein [Microbacterium sp. LjRoot45]|uniref:RNA polymerase sigma factor n=1 Tax=Microbacterium sp. LjRoot45 TaxID=3342329 RepID=UPI003ECE6E82
MNPTDAATPPRSAAPDGEGVAASDHQLARLVRDESARIVGILTAATGNLDVAEEATAEAIEEALRAWRQHGVPTRPGGWLLQAARHNALDRLRRETRYREKLEAVRALTAEDRHPTGGDDEPDERVPLLFGCCHPALAPEAQLALTLRAVLGVTTAQIARATLEPESTVGQRISRAKRKMAAVGIPLGIPEGAERVDRLDIVLTVVSVLYDAAHLRAGADAVADRDLADDALWLARVVAEALPREAEAAGLHALLLLHRAREPARSRGGDLVLLDAQDRSLWDAALIARGRAELNRAAALRSPGRWQLHAAIAACHVDAPTIADTDWVQMLVLYDMLRGYDGSPIVALNRAVVLSRVAGAQAALADVDALAGPLSRYHLWHAVRARLLRDLGREAEADEADRRAAELTSNVAEQRLLAARRTH